jgi:hypothetical protein
MKWDACIVTRGGILPLVILGNFYFIIPLFPRGGNAGKKIQRLR